MGAEIRYILRPADGLTEELSEPRVKLRGAVVTAIRFVTVPATPLCCRDLDQGPRQASCSLTGRGSLERPNHAN